MSLLENYSREYVFLDKERKPDGEGGYHTTWKETVPFIGTLSVDTTMQARIAESQGLTSVYTLYTAKNIKFNYHDIFKDIESGEYYRVTSESGLKETPDDSELNLSSVTVEKLKGLPV